MSAPIPPNPQMAGKKKTSPWLFVLIGCGGLIVVVGVAMLALGFFAVQKAKDIGLDPEMLKDKPALAVAKMVVAANPDIELVDIDEEGEVITVREIKTGKTVKVNLDDLKEGRISFEGDDGEEVSVGVSGEGSAGTLDVVTPEGSYQYGASATVDLPDWLPVYPGAEAKGVMKSETPEGRAGSAVISTSDSVEQVMEFYKKALEDAGMKVSTVQTGGASSGAMVSGETEGGKRGAIIMVGTGNEGTSASVSYTIKE